jgi:hypothetical protein
MKDGLLLLVSAIGIAIVCWCFWHFAGESAFQILTSVALIALFAENLRLRRELRKRSA